MNNKEKIAQKIEEILLKFGELQTSLGSKTARQIIALEITNAVNELGLSKLNKLKKFKFKQNIKISKPKDKKDLKFSGSRK